MYVCLCRNVTDTQIRAAAREGIQTMAGLGERLGVATQCGRCGTCARKVLAEEQIHRWRECDIPAAGVLASGTA